jgi:hypothetical protein
MSAGLKLFAFFFLLSLYFKFPTIFNINSEKSKIWDDSFSVLHNTLWYFHIWKFTAGRICLMLQGEIPHLLYLCQLFFDLQFFSSVCIVLYREHSISPLQISTCQAVTCLHIKWHILSDFNKTRYDSTNCTTIPKSWISEKFLRW